MQVAVLRNQIHECDVVDGAEALARARAVQEKRNAERNAERMKMFAPIQPPEFPVEVAPIDIPKFIPFTRWDGRYWCGNFDHLVRAAYPGDYPYREKWTVNAIIRAVSAASGVDFDDIKGHRRTSKLIEPRHVAMALAQHLTTLSLPDIGRRFGGRDHTTILHACRKMSDVMEATKKNMLPISTLQEWANEGIRCAKIIKPSGYQYGRHRPEI